ncbi:MAG: hypothetical protein KC468_35640, partial [Myxococcales bacterium]|nr:hypothetical protein [Myxococcales bacterium]
MSDRSPTSEPVVDGGAGSARGGVDVRGAAPEADAESARARAAIEARLFGGLFDGADETNQAGAGSLDASAAEERPETRPETRPEKSAGKSAG